MRIDYPAAGQIPALKALWKEAFRDPPGYIDTFFQTGFSSRRCRCATSGGALAGMLYWFECACRGRKLAYLYAVATAPAFRGQGICRGLMADTHRLLSEQGFAGVLLVPGEASLSAFYGAMGYRYIAGIQEKRCAPGPDPLPLTAVTPEEYCRLRRALLPEGGVVQEGENMEFLASQADFFAGDGLLFPVIREENRLFVPELLGAPAAAPGILRALDAPEGLFRLPGGPIPYAMYLPLDNSPAPTHFAFAFD